jgi:hypothetical protein
MYNKMSDIMIFKVGIQLFLLLFLAFFTIFIESVNAQYAYDNHGLYIEFPRGTTPMETIVNGIVTVTSGFQTVQFGFWDYEFCMEDDGSYMVLQFFPNSTSSQALLPGGQPLCTIERPEEVTINTIDAIKVNTKCNYGFRENISEQYIMLVSDKIAEITFRAPDQFTFDSHHQEFVSSLSTLQLLTN